LSGESREEEEEEEDLVQGEEAGSVQRYEDSVQ